MTIDEAIQRLKTTDACDSELCEALDMAIKALEQEPCGDAISRQAVLEVIRKCHCEEWVKADIDAPIDALPSVSPQPCDDCISREETLKALMDEWTEFDSELIDSLIGKIKKLSPVTPQQKIGKWNKSMDDYSYFYTCSCCGQRIAKNGFGDDLFSPYCPECGAKMQEVENG